MPRKRCSALVKTRKEAAARLGVTERGLGNWTHEPWFPAGAKTEAGWDVAAIEAARDAMGRKGSESSDESRRIKLATDAEKLKHARAETRTAELKLREREGELLPRRPLELFAATLLTQLGDWCDQLPELVSDVVPKKHRDGLTARLKEVLNRRRVEMRDELQRKAAELDRQS